MKTITYRCPKCGDEKTRSKARDVPKPATVVVIRCLKCGSEPGGPAVKFLNAQGREVYA